MHAPEGFYNPIMPMGRKKNIPFSTLILEKSPCSKSQTYLPSPSYLQPMEFPLPVWVRRSFGILGQRKKKNR